MDHARRAFYDVKVENALMKLKGNAFQDWFASVMERRYPKGDFVRVRPWGSLGDRKNDGYIQSRRTLCQVYAPNDLDLATTLAKIEEDFEEGKKYWKKHFDTWIFVHNAHDGIAGDVLKCLKEKSRKNPSIEVTQWGPSAIRDFVFELDDANIVGLLGPAPGRLDYESLGLKDLQPVLLKLAGQDPVSDGDVRPVPPCKIEANGLSSSVSLLLKAGMPKADLVRRFFDTYHDVNLGDRIAAAFQAEYARLRGTGMGPDTIFSALVDHAGGLDRGPANAAAVLAVIAFLFEQCEIFERPSKVPT